MILIFIMFPIILSISNYSQLVLIIAIIPIPIIILIIPILGMEDAALLIHQYSPCVYLLNLFSKQSEIHSKRSVWSRQSSCLYVVSKPKKSFNLKQSCQK